MRSWSRSKLIIAIATARRWLEEITSGNADIETIAKHEGRSKRHVSTNLTLAFLDPTIVKAAVDGQLPNGFGITRLTNLSPDWSEQRRQLGL
jgi:site-specific DNA recombinase